VIVYRIMSEKEYENWKKYGVKGLYFNGRKTKRMLWLAMDVGYIGTILMREMYNNRLVGEAYTRIVVFDLQLKQEIKVNLKSENGFLNIGINAKYMDSIVLKELGFWDVNFYMKLYLKRDVRPLMFYWNSKGECRVLVTKKQVKNILWNGRLDKRAWFMRADVYEKVMQYGRV